MYSVTNIKRQMVVIADEAADINTMFHNSETYKLYFNNGQ